MKHGWLCVLGLLLIGGSAAPAEPLPFGPACECSCSCLPDRPEAPDPRFWLSGDYLLWWMKGMPLDAPLVTTGPATDPFPGVIGQPGTRVLVGNEEVHYGGRSGFRLNGGGWLDADRTLGVEAGFFFLDNGRRHAAAFGGPDGNPVLGHPFVNANTGNENLYFVSVPGNVGGVPLLGRTAVTTDTRFGGYDVNLAVGLVREPGWRLRGLVGYRALVLKESLTLADSFSSAAPNGLALFQNGFVNPPSGLALVDSFAVHNRFHGGQVGGQLDWSAGRASVSLVARVALGVTEQIAFVDGFTQVVGPGAPSPAAGGTYAQATNVGRHFRSTFAAVPEVGLNAGYALTDWLAVRVGYNFLYWSSVSRPGDLIDRGINPNRVPSDVAFGTPGGASRPAVRFRERDFWAHGLNFGLALSF